MTARDVAFVKMHGAGNDYVFVDALAAPFAIERAPTLARAWSDRHRGIGADGLIVLAAASGRDGAVGRMHMWNADGSRGAFCGNGLRCLAALARDAGHAHADRFALESDAGLHRAEVVRDAAGTIVAARVTVPGVRLDAAPLSIACDGIGVELFRGDAGNPHAVIVATDPDPERWPVARVGNALQRHPAFPGGVNVSFVRPVGPDRLRQRTFERGSGETLACGSGATVAALTALRLGLVAGPRISVALPGGELVVEPASGDGGAPILAGPVATVFRGTIRGAP